MSVAIVLVNGSTLRPVPQLTCCAPAGGTLCLQDKEQTTQERKKREEIREIEITINHSRIDVNDRQVQVQYACNYYP